MSSPVALLVSFAVGILNGFVVVMAFRTRFDIKGPYWQGNPLGRWWMVKALWHHGAGWHNRVAIIFCLLIVALQTVQGHVLLTWIYFVLYVFLTQLFITNIATRGYSFGLIEQDMPKFLDEVTEAMREAIGNKANAAFVDVGQLLTLADQYGVPPQEIEQLIWREQD